MADVTNTSRAKMSNKGVDVVSNRFVGPQASDLSHPISGCVILRRNNPAGTVIFGKLAKRKPITVDLSRPATGEFEFHLVPETACVSLVVRSDDELTLFSETICTDDTCVPMLNAVPILFTNYAPVSCLLGLCCFFFSHTLASLTQLDSHLDSHLHLRFQTTIAN